MSLINITWECIRKSTLWSSTVIYIISGIIICCIWSLVLVGLHLNIVYRTGFWCAPLSLWKSLFSVLISPLMSCLIKMVMIKAITGMFMSMAMHLNYESRLSELCNFGSAIAHLMGCFCPWNFFLEYLTKHVTIGLYVQLMFSTRILNRRVQVLQLIVHAVLSTMD